MGRRREFDEDEVLQLIEERFWRDGYRATSMQDIAAATGVKPGSLFKCFGGKEDMYMAALGRYAQENSPRAHLLQLFDLPLLEALRRFFGEIIDRVERGSSIPCGCLVSNHVSELNTLEDDVADPSIELMKSTRQTIQLRLMWAREQGELAKDADVDTLSAHLFCLLQGLYVLSVSTRSVKDMRSALAVSLSTLEPHIKSA